VFLVIYRVESVDISPLTNTQEGILKPRKMISRERFRQIQPGDYVWFGRAWRKVISAEPHQTTYILEFKKINWYRDMGTTTYVYADIYKKIKGVCKLKPRNND
jgi:hypothetical protein